MAPISAHKVKDHARSGRFRPRVPDGIFSALMTAGMFIVGVCAVGGVLACVAFWWATRSGEFSDAAEARFLVFDDDELPAARAAERRPGGPA